MYSSGGSRLESVNAPAESAAKQRSVAILVLGSLAAVYALARVLQVFPGRVPMLAVVSLHVLPSAVFALIHGAFYYRLRGILAFLVICLVVGNIFENMGVLTGFPFGRYYFTNLMGPKLLAVPVLLGIAYVGMAYLAWTLACLIMGGVRRPLTGSRIVTLPLAASFLMVAWDLSQDPVWSTILHAWIWPHGGAYFGVPVSNFLGWFLTVYVMYQCFAIYLWSHPPKPGLLPSGYWNFAVLFYGLSAAGNVFLAIPAAGASVVSDSSGAMWKVSDITATCALVSVFTMGAFALLAWGRIADQNRVKS